MMLYGLDERIGYERILKNYDMHHMQRHKFILYNFFVHYFSHCKCRQYFSHYFA